MEGSLGITFAVEGVTQVHDFDTRLNLKKRLFHFGFRGKSINERVNLSFLSLGEAQDRGKVVVADRSYSILENRDREDSGYTIFDGGSFYTFTPSFMVTNIFATQTATQTNVPLFYGHTLRYFNPTNSDWSSRSLVDVRFADANHSPRLVSAYYVDETDGILFNNLRNLWQNGVLDLTYVIYSVKITSGGSSYVQTYHEILNNIPAYHVASYDDLGSTGGLSPTAHAYLLDNAPAGDKYVVTLPLSDTWAYTEDVEDTRLAIRLPSKTSSRAPWFPRVASGEFIAPIDIDVVTTYFKYRIAEFSSQTFSPYSPYKYYTDEEATQVADNAIKFNRSVVYNSLMPIELVLKDESDAVVAVYTTDSAKVGTVYSGEIEYEEGILSVDEFHGFIELEQRLAANITITGTFYSTCDEYELTAINLNPLSNLGMLSTRAVIYIVPETVYTGSLSNTLFYLLVDETGRITYSSQAAEDTGATAAAVKLRDEDFFADGTPRHDFFYDIVSTSGLEWRPTGPSSVYQNDFSFLDKYTSETAYATTLSGLTPLSLLNYQKNPQFFVLGDIYVGQQASIYDVERLDIRKRGGGIRPLFEEEAIAEQHEVVSMQDFARVSFPGGMALYVEYPQSLLVTHSGSFTEEQVSKILHNHLQAGGYAVARPYGDRTPVIQSGVTTSGSIAIGWASYGDDATYDIYMSTALDRGYQAVATGIADDSLGNMYEIDSLVPSKRYYVYIKTHTPTEDVDGLPVTFLTVGYDDTPHAAVYDEDVIYDVSLYG